MKFGAAKIHMRIMYIMLNWICMLLGGLMLVLPHTAAGDENALLLKSRELTAQYGTLLKAALQDSMAKGGPVAAIDVCKEKAPQIAAELSDSSGATVRRTSLKNRNPGNAPEPWEAAVLTEFDSGSTSESFTITNAGEARYMKAIPTAALCLACHGQELAPEIQGRLNEAYPDDNARGYSVGQIRGAFSITWPATTLD
jgi:hypothetical protein